MQGCGATGQQRISSFPHFGVFESTKITGGAPVSFPDWLDQGFANPHFPWLYERFVAQIVSRYPWVAFYYGLQ
jgi:hypothetical protein